MTKIEWTEKTWNPISGCSPVSAGCHNCYAERQTKRLKAMGQAKYKDGFEVRCHRGELDRPFHWRKPRMVFVCSMSDLFHPDVPDTFIGAVFHTMQCCEQHIFQLLTKRPERMAEYAKMCTWPKNVWAGTTVEDSGVRTRLGYLRMIPAPVRFVSCEPLLGQIPLNLHGIDWVIVGGETGPGARPMDPNWARYIQEQCAAKGVPFFFKKHGGSPGRKLGKQYQGLLDGVECRQMPEVLVKEGS